VECAPSNISYAQSTTAIPCFRARTQTLLDVRLCPLRQVPYPSTALRLPTLTVDCQSLLARRQRWSAAVSVQAHARSRGIYGGQTGTNADFLRVLRFPLPFLISLSAPHASFIIRGRYKRLNSGRRTTGTPSHPYEPHGTLCLRHQHFSRTHIAAQSV
jgi:hypothetical protein